ncbi:hypothetical protein IHE45_20G010100 [Dioscorea alata]|uniref:Uncharacterized protein n=1 Tax=Dioscorea alata TaxID=55571 RepID=A0ACB7TQG3_DIOAL|nr:hypothetical protein IHE45_20G010100 [Dioscorea alata]
MTTGRINQVAPSRATAGGRAPEARPRRGHTPHPGPLGPRGERGSLGGTAPGDARRPRLARVAGDRGRRRGTAPTPRPIKMGIESESAAGKPAARRRWAGQPSRAVGERATLPPEGRAARR